MLSSDGPFGSGPSSVDHKQEYKLWDYNPSVPAAAIAAGVCGLLTLLHTYRLVRSHTGFCIPFIIGGIVRPLSLPQETYASLTQPQLETIGYAARAAAHNNTKSLTPYIVQSLLILLAPIFFAASIYTILGRLIHRLNGDDISIVHPSIMTKSFVFGDVLCFLIQGTGGGMLSQAKTQSAINFGNNIVLFGLVVQIYVFCFFVKIAVSFHRDMAHYPNLEAKSRGFKWRRYFWLLYAACACVGVRNTYRVVEYAMGKVSYSNMYK
jgi:hypothetical protein